MTEREKNLKWEELRPVQKMNILLYLYKFETQCAAELDQSNEAHYFKSYGVSRDQLPLSIAALRGVALKNAAYTAVGRDYDATEAWFNRPDREVFLWEKKPKAMEESGAQIFCLDQRRSEKQNQLNKETITYE